jgi:hypothetical protein
MSILPGNEAGFAVGIGWFGLVPPRFAGNDKTTAHGNLFRSSAPSSTVTLATMRCHIFPVQHKNKTTKSHFSSDKNLNGCVVYANTCSLAHFKRILTQKTDAALY